MKTEVKPEVKAETIKGTASPRTPHTEVNENTEISHHSPHQQKETPNGEWYESYLDDNMNKPFSKRKDEFMKEYESTYTIIKDSKNLYKDRIKAWACFNEYEYDNDITSTLYFFIGKFFKIKYGTSFNHEFYIKYWDIAGLIHLDIRNKDTRKNHIVDRYKAVHELLKEHNEAQLDTFRLSMLYAHKKTGSNLKIFSYTQITSTECKWNLNTRGREAVQSFEEYGINRKYGYEGSDYFKHLNKAEIPIPKYAKEDKQIMGKYKTIIEKCATVIKN